MTRLFSDENIIAQWTNFFEKQCKGDIETIASNYPTTKSLTIDGTKLDEKLLTELTTQPYKLLFNAEQALKQFDTAYGQLDIHLRVENLKDIYPCIPLNKIRAEQLGQFISLEGFIRKTTKVSPRLIIGAFQCAKCGNVIKVEQTENILKEPTECYEDQGGCGRISTFKLIVNLSQFVDYQKVLLQEPPEDIKPGEQAEKIAVRLTDDLVHHVVPGDRIVFSGILTMQPKRNSG